MATSSIKRFIMKNTQSSSSFLIKITAAIFLLTFCSTSLLSQGLREKLHNPLFPNKNKHVLMMGTGIPYVGIAEYSYGFSERFSVGLLAGTTPIVPGYGLRIKYNLYQATDRSRIVFKAPILFYPETKDLGGEPWLLTWPSISYEWRLDSDVRISLGAGVVAAACANDLFGIEHPHSDKDMNTKQILDDGHDHTHEHIQSTGPHTSMPDQGFMGNIWNTVQASISVPIKEHFNFQSELALVFDGTTIADEQWVGRHPVILFIGLSYQF
jgi:hypothetical protein